MFQFWNQLALAGLIEGTYNGLTGSGGGVHSTIGTNSPASKVASAGWSAYTRTTGSMFFSSTVGNTLQFGGAVTGGSLYEKTLRPEEAWNIDTKLDDGRPAYGKVHAIWWDECTDAANRITWTGNYLLSDTTLGCGLSFLGAF